MKKTSLIALTASVSLITLTACSSDSQEGAEPTESVELTEVTEATHAGKPTPSELGIGPIEMGKSDETLEAFKELAGIPDGVPAFATAQEFVLDGRALKVGVPVREFVEGTDLVLREDPSPNALEDFLDEVVSTGVTDFIEFSLPGRDEIVVTIVGMNNGDGEQKMADLTVSSVGASFTDELRDETFGADPASYKDLLSAEDIYFGYPLKDFVDKHGLATDVGGYTYTPSNQPLALDS